MCVTHLLGMYCDGVFLYLHVMANNTSMDAESVLVILFIACISQVGIVMSSVI